MLKLAFLLSKFNSAIAASILSPPTNLEGLASAALTAICDFFIRYSNSHPSGFTVSPLLLDEITCTVIISLIFSNLINLALFLAQLYSNDFDILLWIYSEHWNGLFAHFVYLRKVH